jgi:hypothetical protein
MMGPSRAYAPMTNHYESLTDSYGPLTYGAGGPVAP